jgi:hypothetical protein
MRALFKGHATRPSTRAPITNPSPKRPYLYRAIRRMQSVCSRQEGNGEEDLRRILRRNPNSFALNEFETQQLESLSGRGYAFAPGFFSKGLVDHIRAKADAIFRKMPASTDHTLELEGPLVEISEVLDIAFHESVLKVVAHFFRRVPPLYRVAIVRYLPSDCAPDSSRFRQEAHDSDSLEILIDLAAVDRTRGPLVYVPESHLHVSCRPRLLNAFGFPLAPRQLEDHEVERLYPRETWITLFGEQGSMTAIHRRGLSKGPVWAFPGDTSNKPRTAIRIDITSHRPGIRCEWKGNAMRKWNFDRMSKFQQVFTHAVFVEQQALA